MPPSPTDVLAAIHNAECVMAAIYPRGDLDPKSRDMVADALCDARRYIEELVDRDRVQRHAEAARVAAADGANPGTPVHYDDEITLTPGVHLIYADHRPGGDSRTYSLEAPEGRRALLAEPSGVHHAVAAALLNLATERLVYGEPGEHPPWVIPATGRESRRG